MVESRVGIDRYIYNPCFYLYFLYFYLKIEWGMGSDFPTSTQFPIEVGCRVNSTEAGVRFGVGTLNLPHCEPYAWSNFHARAILSASHDSLAATLQLRLDLPTEHLSSQTIGKLLCQDFLCRCTYPENQLWAHLGCWLVDFIGMPSSLWLA